jgi:hypothetical protein
MASNDPTDTGGLFIGRRPGTAPVRFRPRPPEGTEARRRFDGALGVLLLVIEVLLCLSLLGPQPYGWMWVGSQVQYLSGFVTAGITTIMLGCILSLFVTLMVAKRVDHAWKLVRRAAGHHQERGALERMFAISVVIAVVIFSFWFIVIHGPGSSVFPGRPS